MESQTLYRVKKEDLPKLEKLLVKCFAHDPLYCKLIPEKRPGSDCCRSFLSVILRNLLKPVRSILTARK